MSGRQSSKLASAFGTGRRAGAGAAVAPRERGIYSDVDSSEPANAGPSSVVPSSWGAAEAAARGAAVDLDAATMVPRRPAAGTFKPSSSASRYTRGREAVPDARSSRADEPRVFAPRERRAGKTPRRIQVERRRRQFTSQSLDELLVAQGVDYSRAAPDGAGEGEASLLPLEAFDDTSFEIHEPADWMALADEDGTTVEGPGVPGRGLFRHDDGSGTWTPCRAVAWDAAEHLFTVVWGDTASADSKNASLLPELAGMEASDAPASPAGRSGRFAASRSGAGAAPAAGAGAGAGAGEDSKDDEIVGRPGVAASTTAAAVLKSHAGTRALLPRVEICFHAEDPSDFAARVGEAHRLRRQAEALMHYQLVVDCMPTEGVPGLNSEQVSRVLSSVHASRAVRESGLDATDLLRDASLDNQRTMNKLLLDSHIRDARGRGLLSLIKIPADHPAISGSGMRPAAPASGVVPVPAHDITETFAHFSFHSHLTRVEVIDFLALTQSECVERVLRPAEAGSAFLLTAPQTRSLRLAEFEHAHGNATAAFATVLRDVWAPAVRGHARHCLGGVGRGAYNLREGNQEMYRSSKLRLLLNRINFVMADSLRTAVQTVVSDWVRFVSRAAAGVVTVRSTADVQVDYSDCLGTDPTREALPPLFVIDVAVEEVEATEEEKAALAAAAAAAAASAAGEGDGEGEEASEDGGEDEESKSRDGAAADAAAQAPATRRVFRFSTSLDALLAAPATLLERGLAALEGVVQVERQVMDRLIWAHEPKIPVPTKAEQWVRDACESISESLASRREPLERLLATLDTYLPLLNLDVDALIASLHKKHSEDFQLRDLRALVEQHLRDADAVFAAVPSHVDCGVAQVKMEDVRALLVEKHRTIARRILSEIVAAHAQEVSAGVVTEFRRTEKALGAEPSDIEELADLKALVDEVPNKVKEQRTRMTANEESYAVLERHHHILEKSAFDTRWSAWAGPKRIADKLRETHATMERCQAEFLSEMEREQSSFEEDLNTVHSEVLSLQQMHDMDKMPATVALVRRLKTQIASYKEKASVFNMREGLFGREETEYSRMAEIQKAFEPYCTLWETLAEWRESQAEWMTCPFTSLDSEEVERVHSRCYKNMAKSIKTFERLGAAECLDIAAAERQAVDDFRPVLPVVQGLRNQGMRPRHWAELRDAAGVDVPDEPGEDFTLTRVLDLGLVEHKDTIGKIGERAGKEYQIEMALAKMKSAWKSVQLVADPYRETGTSILTGATIEEVLALLDEHVNMTSAMAFSSFKKHFTEEIDEWTATLNMAGEVIDEWIKVQRSWLYLQPIFDSPDIQKQLPKEYKRFATVDKN